MLISLNWIRDFVDLPEDLDSKALAERFTRTTAEVDDCRPIQVGAAGLIVARVEAVKELPGTKNVRLVVLDIGNGRTAETVSAAPSLHPGLCVVYAPIGASVAAFGAIKTAHVAGRPSAGMILPGEAIGIEMAAQEAVHLAADVEPGEELSPALFDDWIIEVDNKSITHRPDLWGHYGVAREIAALLGRPLKPYPLESLDRYAALSEVPITIADGRACRRYCGLILRNVPARPAPLWMQLRLGHVGLRPINGLVDLTNYVMADLGQPMHAFDAGKVDRIEVAWASEGERFRTLDGCERVLTRSDLMVQCRGRSIAIAGVMGGRDSEVSETTAALLLESANFDPATIRRTAARLGLRTDASARFEKSLDPLHAETSIRRFVALARGLWPDLSAASRLSDNFPGPRPPVTVALDPRRLARTMGREVSRNEVVRLLTPLGFAVGDDRGSLRVQVPSYRATNDVSIEADVIEEVARLAGYDQIAPAMPRVTVRRFPPNALHELEQRTLEYFTSVHRFHEIHGYIWYDDRWLRQLGMAPGPCIELQNPAADGLHRLRRTLMPGLLAAVAKNRFHFSSFSLVELGGVFEPRAEGDREFRRLGLAAAQRGKQGEDQLVARLKEAISGWAWQRFAREATFRATEGDAACPWVDPARTAELAIDSTACGTIGVIPLALRQAMDEHLSSWSIAWAELGLDEPAALPSRTERLGKIPAYPRVDLDFSLVIPKTVRYVDVTTALAGFNHSLLTDLRYLGHYEGDSIGADRRSLTFKTVLGHSERTLTEQDAAEFREAFERYVRQAGYDVRH